MRNRDHTMPVAVEDDMRGGLYLPGDGRTMRNLDATWHSDAIERFRDGYKCLGCWEELEQAHPERCPVCNFKVRDEQTERFAREFAGSKWIGPDKTLEEVRALDDEERARDGYASAAILVPTDMPGSQRSQGGVLLPPGVSG